MMFSLKSSSIVLLMFVVNYQQKAYLSLISSIVHIITFCCYYGFAYLIYIYASSRKNKAVEGKSTLDLNNGLIFLKSLYLKLLFMFPLCD